MTCTSLADAEDTPPSRSKEAASAEGLLPEAEPWMSPGSDPATAAVAAELSTTMSKMPSLTVTCEAALGAPDPSPTPLFELPPALPWPFELPPALPWLLELLPLPWPGLDPFPWPLLPELLPCP